jgi:hypothetical protein
VSSPANGPLTCRGKICRNWHAPPAPLLVHSSALLRAGFQYRVLLISTPGPSRAGRGT